MHAQRWGPIRLQLLSLHHTKYSLDHDATSVEDRMYSSRFAPPIPNRNVEASAKPREDLVYEWSALRTPQMRLGQEGSGDLAGTDAPGALGSLG